MSTKKDLETKAKALISGSPEEAVTLYRELWETYPDLFNYWDAFYTIKAMRTAKRPDLNWAKELTEKFNNTIVGNLYGWLIFDKCVKGKTRADLISNEPFISSLTVLSPQKNLKTDKSYPCPTTISILALCEAYAENQFNGRKINDLLNGLDVNFLSDSAKSIETEERGEVELSSDLEKYFALKTKALFKLGEFEACRDQCRIGLGLFQKFHYNNDLWFKMRIALSEDKLGNHEISEHLLKELLVSKAGSDKWFLYRDIAEVYFEQSDFNKAWKFAVDAAFYGNEPHFLIGLYLLQARILIKINRPTEGKILAELVAAILKEQQWSDKAEYNKLFQFHQIDRQSLRPINEIIKEARLFWSRERYGNSPKLTGVVISISKNGKTGRIKEKSGTIVDFHKKDLQKKMKTIEDIKGASVEFFKIEAVDGNYHAENITIVENSQRTKPDDLVGNSFEGTVKNVADFGVFVKLKGAPDGLLHRNNLPGNLRANFREVFTPGKVIRVKVDKVTQKGVQLILE